MPGKMPRKMTLYWKRSCAAWLSLALLLVPVLPVFAQDPLTGAFEGSVTDTTGKPIPGAVVQFINQNTDAPVAKKADTNGNFYYGLLVPGRYTIRVTVQGYKPYVSEQRLIATRPNTVQPLPIKLEPDVAVTPATTTPTGNPTGNPTGTGAATTPTGANTTTAAGNTGATGKSQPVVSSDAPTISTATDARRDGAFGEEEVTRLPIGATTYTRSFDELALLLPGVALPPYTPGQIAGPGVGAGVGSAGQFAVNGLRSRANNFTVDGSDNNDEDIGVRRQGFLTLVPQPVESIREYQVITALAPAQFGRNLAAQINAISKAGGNAHHGTLTGLLNTSHLNAREYFDTTNGNAAPALTAGNNQAVVFSRFIDEDNEQLTPIRLRNGSGSKDSFTLGQFSATLGGPLGSSKAGATAATTRLFYFVSAESQLLNANREANFAVPTVEQRGFRGTGATGITRTPFYDISGLFEPGESNYFYPTTIDGDVIFSYFPFANNPQGIYGRNTFTQTLPASGRGVIASGKVDTNFNWGGRQQTFTTRYNFTDDERILPVTGGAIFSSLRPRVRTQNVSSFLNSTLSTDTALIPVYNQLRISYGRTRLNFEDATRRGCGLPEQCLQPSRLLPKEKFLLNAIYTENRVLPDFGVPNTDVVRYGIVTDDDDRPVDTESAIGPVGQINIAGFSPLGVDVFNFPQERVNNTYQIADTLTLRVREHSLALGADVRRSELNSYLPLNSRPIITFGGSPKIAFDGPITNARNVRFISDFEQAIDLAAVGAASGFQQTFATGPADIRLRYYQYNFFGQDEWRLRPNVSLSFGLRYEYNTPPRDGQQRIEKTFADPNLALVPGVRQFINGRKQIFDADRNNFAPRVGLAYSPVWFGPKRATVLRGGYGLYYDQVLGAVVSQSRNVFPTFITANVAGGGTLRNFGDIGILSPYNLFVLPPSYLENDTLNRIRTRLESGQALSTADVVNFINRIAACGFRFVDAKCITSPAENVFSVTLPDKKLKSPYAHHYSFSIEQQLSLNTFVSLAYIGTRGKNLLRFTTPNLGPNAAVFPYAVNGLSITPDVSGFAVGPGSRLRSDGAVTDGRPVPGIGAVNVFETTAESRYDSLQVQLRGDILGKLQYNMAYTLAKALDDVSDVFDLAGAAALPQNSLRPSEYGPANFDTRHRLALQFTYQLPGITQGGRGQRLFRNGWEVTGTAQYQSGQPFTVNSINDVNLDGNLTDRLNTTVGITRPVGRQRSLGLLADPRTLLAVPGQDGAVGRNTFRASDYLLINLAINKNFALTEQQQLTLRVEGFNLINRANFGIPVRQLEAPGFGLATETVTPGRRVQFALKYSF